MDSLLLYLLKVAAGTTLFYLSYLLLFRNETFYVRNRIFLILTLILPTVLPFISLPVLSGSFPEAPTYSYIIHKIVVSSDSSQTTFSGPVNPFDYNRLFVWIYFIVAGYLLLRIIISITSTCLIIKKGTVENNQVPRLILTDKQLPPFSFFLYAVIPYKDYKSGNYSYILDHEAAHIRQGHTFDLLLSELLIAFQWFNPFIWLIKRSIILNHEYLADNISLSKNKSPLEYQYRLLNFQNDSISISMAHNFNSSIKNRIVMINKKPTPKFAAWKTILILPVLAMALYAFARPENNYNIPFEADHSKEIRGIVAQMDGKPLQGASIVLKGTTIGTSSDSKGQFRLINVPEEAMLVVSYVGFKTIIEKPDFSSEMVINMSRSTISTEKVSITPPSGSSSTDNVMKLVEEMPEYPGGANAMLSWISDNVRYPREAINNNIEGLVHVNFTVSSSGKIKNVQVIKSVHQLLDTEAIRVVSDMPDWKPGSQNGIPVDVDYVVPVDFDLPDGKQGSLLSDASTMEILKFLAENARYPQEAKNSLDTGKVFVSVKINKGGKVRETDTFIDKKDVKVPILNEEIVIIGYLPSEDNIKKSDFSGEHPELRSECLRLANKLEEIDVPEWNEKNMEFAVAIKFVLKHASPAHRVYNDPGSKEIINPNR